MEEFIYAVSPILKKEMDEYYDAHPELTHPKYQAFIMIEEDPKPSEPSAH